MQTGRPGFCFLFLFINPVPHIRVEDIFCSNKSGIDWLLVENHSLFFYPDGWKRFFRDWKLLPEIQNKSSSSCHKIRCPHGKKTPLPRRGRGSKWNEGNRRRCFSKQLTGVVIDPLAKGNNKKNLHGRGWYSRNTSEAVRQTRLVQIKHNPLLHFLDVRCDNTPIAQNMSCIECRGGGDPREKSVRVRIIWATNKIILCLIRKQREKNAARVLPFAQHHLHVHFFCQHPITPNGVSLKFSRYREPSYQKKTRAANRKNCEHEPIT